MKCASEGCKTPPTRHFTSMGKKRKGTKKRRTLLYVSFCQTHARRLVSLLGMFFDEKKT